jgi:lysophospholipid acyltransferase (LPLAT)-like uncharacterized protein
VRRFDRRGVLVHRAEAKASRVTRIVWAILEWPLALLSYLLARTIRSTARITIEGTEPDGPAMYVNWHRYQSFLIPFHGERRRWMLVSPVPQLAAIARFCRLCGLRLVRGASGERGKEAREELKNLLLRGESVVLAVDGPAGPAFKAKRGCAELSRAAGVPIVPMRFRSNHAHEFRWRWDRTLMPFPFSRITVMCGKPIVSEGSDEDLLAAVEEGLNALEG